MVIVNNNRNYNFKEIIDNYDFSHNHAALVTFFMLLFVQLFLLGKHLACAILELTYCAR